jgi:hypothetical protein
VFPTEIKRNAKLDADLRQGLPRVVVGPVPTGKRTRGAQTITNSEDRHIRFIICIAASDRSHGVLDRPRFLINL